MKAIIFGINGQDGAYLSAILDKQGIEVTGVSRTNLKYIIGDVSNYGFVESLVKSIQPDFVFHLAANSTTRHDTLIENYETISTGSINVLEAVYKHSKQAKVFISGSGLQFVNSNEPIHETDPFEARDAYSMARIQSVYAARYFRRLGLKVYIGYFFNHDSPFRTERHVNQKIVLATKRIAAGSIEKLHLGDITVKKEFSFAGDISKAIWTLVNNDIIFEAVIGSGKAYTIENWLELCFNYYNLKWSDYVVLDSHYLSEYKILVSNPSSLFSLGWKPTVTIDELALMMLEF
ncbi:MAG: GDP-mannose 4,6-dehydratase [Mucilaginibacter sp.]